MPKKWARSFPAHVLAPDQPQIGLMDQGGGLKGVIPSLAPHVSAGGSTQLSVDGREESLAIVGRTGLPPPEQGRQIVSRYLDTPWPK